MAFVRDDVPNHWSAKKVSMVPVIDTNPFSHADRATNDRFAHHKKVVVSGGGGGGENDIVRRGNGNIIAPAPITWEESRPKLRQTHQSSPHQMQRTNDDYLLKFVNNNDAYKEKQVKNMARCGQENFYRGFSQQPPKHVGTQKVHQNAVHQGGIGIWGFGGMGRMSEETTNGLRKHHQQAPLHLAPLESNAALQNRLSSPIRAAAENAVRPPWGRHDNDASNMSAHSFNDNNNINSCNNRNSPHRNHNNLAPLSPRSQNKRSQNTNSSAISNCLKFTDKNSNDVELRQRPNKFPNPSTVPFTNNVEYVSSPHQNHNADGYTPKRVSPLPLAARSNLAPSPEGAKFPSRNETTAGKAFVVGGYGYGSGASPDR